MAEIAARERHCPLIKQTFKQFADALQEVERHRGEVRAALYQSAVLCLQSLTTRVCLWLEFPCLCQLDLQALRNAQQWFEVLEH